MAGRSFSSCSNLSPVCHRRRSEALERLARNEMALYVEQIVDGGVDREELLR